ncbi:hypothetical protein BGZ98_000263, partial [Dissophora globulifera]
MSSAASSATASVPTETSFSTASVTPAPSIEMAVSFDMSTIRPITATIAGYELCEPFKQFRCKLLQQSTTSRIRSHVASYSYLFANLMLLLKFDIRAVNYIRISSTPLSGLTRGAHNEITRSEYFAWAQKNEDTFARGAVDIILKHFFLKNILPYEFNWANRSTSGSKARRSDPLKRDATIRKFAMEVAYIEIKVSKDSRSQSKFVEDFWSLASEARDQIDLHLRNQRSMTVVPCIQIFGKMYTYMRGDIINCLYAAWHQYI